jgi:hypothetical protein
LTGIAWRQPEQIEDNSLVVLVQRVESGGIETAKGLNVVYVDQEPEFPAGISPNVGGFFGS